MISERPLSELTALADLFSGKQLQMVREALLAGNTAGRLWMLEPEQTALLWDQGNNVFYLVGRALSNLAEAELKEMVLEEVQPAALRDGARYFRVRGMSPQLDALVPKLFPGVSPQRSTKRFYCYGADQPPAVSGPAAPELTIIAIDQAFFAAERENRATVLGEISWMWPGTSDQAVSRFLEHGFGSAAVAGDRIVCWCTAEYVSDRLCGIGIETIAAYQRQGIATATTAHFVAASLARGLKPHWECDSANLPSVRVAEKGGFQLVEEAEFWTGLFPLP